jgi:hypothetical protein
MKWKEKHEALCQASLINPASKKGRRLVAMFMVMDIIGNIVFTSLVLITIGLIIWVYLAVP